MLAHAERWRFDAGCHAAGRRRPDEAARQDRQAARRVLLSEGRDLRLHEGSVLVPRSYEDFVGAGAEVIGISRDDAKSHADFKSHHRLPFTLLSRRWLGRARVRRRRRCSACSPGRVTFVFDKAGKVPPPVRLDAPVRPARRRGARGREAARVTDQLSGPNRTVSTSKSSKPPRTIARYATATIASVHATTCAIHRSRVARPRARNSAEPGTRKPRDAEPDEQDPHDGRCDSSGAPSPRRRRARSRSAPRTTARSVAPAMDVANRRVRRLEQRQQERADRAREHECRGDLETAEPRPARAAWSSSSRTSRSSGSSAGSFAASTSACAQSCASSAQPAAPRAASAACAACGQRAITCA